ncbi:hypothetical protein WOLCODRAFT_51086, partial [Wolfiporia cocos MD-104 SS10]
SDKTAGGTILFIATIIFIYYTLWTILLPFFDTSSPIHAVFPSREWAVRIPSFILILGMSAIGLFLGTTIIK